jgi:NADH dehydrogenase/NADH:ubiquinone oxidoreductase subunit G
MKECVEIVVDNQTLVVNRNISVLKVLRDCGLAIPSLCFQPALEGYGSCGLCVVEVCSGNIWRSEHACLLKPENGLQVVTVTPRIRQLRAWAAALLLRRGPFLRKEVDELLLGLLQEGAGGGKSAQTPNSLGAVIEAQLSTVTAGCILCGLCVRICRKIGKSRLTFLGRGKNLRVGLVARDSEAVSCGPCRACRHICPTGFITPDAQQSFTARLYR